MKAKNISKMVLLLILCNLGIILISPSINADEKYHLGFTDKTNFTLIYEYTVVDDDKLEHLFQTTGVELYEDLAEIDEGERFKMVITDIEEDDNDWSIEISLYSGNNLDESGDDIEVKVYKDPEDLVEELFEESENEASAFYFMPLDVEDYLEDFNTLVIEDDRYLEEDYYLYLDERELIFDYTSYGYSDIFVQEYNNDGILESLIILCDGKEAFKRELVDSYEDYSVTVYSTIIIITSFLSILGSVAYISYRRKRLKPSEPQNKIDKMLKKIK